MLKIATSGLGDNPRCSSFLHNSIPRLHSRISRDNNLNSSIWGDAKTGNILSRENDCIVLIDFGGGYTKGWMDDENS